VTFLHHVSCSTSQMGSRREVVRTTPLSG
jgi:hypothetical protein